MSETDELFSSVNYIKNKVDTLEKIETLRLADDKLLEQKFKTFLTSNNNYLQIYKAIDGTRSQKEIAQLTGINEMQVSRIINKLESERLIELISMKGKTKIYNCSIIEKIYKFKAKL